MGIKEKQSQLAKQNQLEMNQKITYPQSDKDKLTKAFMETYKNDQTVLLEALLSMQKQDGHFGQASWKKRYTILNSTAILFYKPNKKDEPVQVGSLSLGNCAVF